MSEQTKVSKDYIDVLLNSLEYRFTNLGKRTLCQAVLTNDFGEFVLADGFAGCLDPANFDEEIGKKIAFENAKKLAENKLWELEGYKLFCKLGNDIQAIM